MKLKTFFIAVYLFVGTSILTAQVFNTSSTLKPGTFSVGIEPGVYVNGDVDPNLFLHGGIGITRGVDMGLKLGVMGNDVYLGGDVEFALGKIFSVAAGAHSFGVFGLDAMGILTIPLGSKADFITGLDMDIAFTDNLDIPLWIPLGIEIPLKKYVLFVFETEVCVNGYYHFIGGGVNFLF